jgi:2,3-bisphosphoglycerate-dependent phosphoglycerate mutase
MSVSVTFVQRQTTRRRIASPTPQSCGWLVCRHLPRVSEPEPLPIATDKRLAERVLATVDLPNWLAILKSSFDDLDRCFAGGESSRTAMQRAFEVVSEAMADPASTTLLATHGNLMTLLLKHFDDRIGFAHWQQLTYPDVYRITCAVGRAEMARIWDV